MSLFTKVPIERAKEIAHERLVNDTTLDDRTLLSPDEVTKLLDFCLSATYLAFCDKFYQQAFGTAMGSPVSVTVANLVMEEVEERALATFQQPPLFWKRYVDDICTALKDSEVECFQEDGTLSTTVYRKKTHTDKYLSFDSHHPLSHKVSVARTLFSRAEKVCSTVGERDNERKHVTDALRANGYPMNIIEMNTQSRQRPRSTDDDREREDPKATVLLPYIRHVSECIRRILTPLDIRTCFKPHVTLRHLLVHPKDPIPIDQKKRGSVPIIV